MGNPSHPFKAVADIAASNGLVNLKLKQENGGDYVRLYQDKPPLFFKHRDDPSDSFDREYFGKSKRILLSEEDCAEGPEATLSLIRTLIDKFADYEPRR